MSSHLVAHNAFLSQRETWLPFVLDFVEKGQIPRALVNVLSLCDDDK